MKSSDVVSVVITLAVLVFILSRQLRPQPAKLNTPLALIVAILGVIDTVVFLKQQGHSGSKAFVALGGSLVLAVILGAIRAYTVRIWMQGDQLWRQGNWLTAALWIVSLALHYGYDYLIDGRGPDAGLGTATALLYFAVTYTVQRYVVLARGQKLAASGG
jgi:hypothetical protein